MKFTEEMIRREYLAICERWHRITFDELRRFGRTAPELAEHYRLVINPELLRAITEPLKKYVGSDDYVTFLGIPVILDERIEAWNILPRSESG